jgi:hypothetical protein
LRGILRLEVFFLLLHAFKYAIIHLKKLLVRHALRLPKSRLLRFLNKFKSFFLRLLFASVRLSVFLNLVKFCESLVDRFATVRFLLVCRICLNCVQIPLFFILVFCQFE